MNLALMRPLQKFEGSSLPFSEEDQRPVVSTHPRLYKREHHVALDVCVISPFFSRAPSHPKSSSASGTEREIVAPP